MNDKTIFLDHDLLVAYVDGELPPERARAVDAALMQDAGAWETVRLLRLSAGAAARAFAPVMEEAIPARLVEAASSSATVVPLRPARRRWPLALSASLAALAIGLGAGYVLHGSRGGYVPASLPDADPLAGRFEATLLAALDRGSDGASFTYGVEGAGQ